MDIMIWEFGAVVRLVGFFFDLPRWSFHHSQKALSVEKLPFFLILALLGSVGHGWSVFALGALEWGFLWFNGLFWLFANCGRFAVGLSSFLGINPYMRQLPPSCVSVLLCFLQNFLIHIFLYLSRHYVVDNVFNLTIFLVFLLNFNFEHLN